jgi:hypothetical protein
MTLSDYKDIAAIGGVVIALLALIKGVYEYVKQGSQKRAEQFLDMRKRLKENDTFRELAALIEMNDPELLKVPFKDKLYYVGFFEEIALMLNSGLIRVQVAHYMFGYYAIRCWDNEYFWSDMNRNTQYWTAFKDFVDRMKAIEASFKYDRRKFRF